jgi:hypothetical protein
MDWFNPGNPKYRRGVVLLTTYVCSLVTVQVLMADFGAQDHIFTPVQAYIHKKSDHFFEITAEELDITSNKVEEDKRLKEESINQKPIFKMTRIDLKKSDEKK